jgi:hypothetical protein
VFSLSREEGREIMKRYRAYLRCDTELTAEVLIAARHEDEAFRIAEESAEEADWEYDADSLRFIEVVDVEEEEMTPKELLQFKREQLEELQQEVEDLVMKNSNGGGGD